MDENSLIRRIAHKREIHQLNTEIERYRKQYEEDSKLLKEITSNKEALEKVAREKYLMKKPNEDIYVFEEELRMKQLIPALFVVGAIMALAGAAVFITGWTYAPYIYTIGAGFIALAQVNTPVKGKSKTLKRLRIQQIFGALALILTGAFMFTTRGNEWIACLTIAAILELYTAFRIPQEEEKEKEEKLYWTWVAVSDRIVHTAVSDDQ